MVYWSHAGLPNLAVMGSSPSVRSMCVLPSKNGDPTAHDLARACSLRAAAWCRVRLGASMSVSALLLRLGLPLPEVLDSDRDGRHRTVRADLWSDPFSHAASFPVVRCSFH